MSMQTLPDPRGTLKPDQRLVVNVFPSPGPWIVAEADTKAESAAQLLPIGMLIQGGEDEHTLATSKSLQPYLPRPRLGEAVQAALLDALRTARSTQTVQTGLEAGFSVLQLAEWNKSVDQLDWRRRYYAPDPGLPAPRDYARQLTLDDALILEVNVSYGTDAADDGHLIPQMTAQSRVYRGGTAHLLWDHQDVVGDQTSSATFTDYQLQPALLTDSLTTLAPALGAAVAASFIKDFAVGPSTSAPAGGRRGKRGAQGGGGLVSMSEFDDLDSTADAAGLAPSTAAAAVAASSTTVAAPPAISSSPAPGTPPAPVPPAVPPAALPQAAPAPAPPH
jgi:hypothetical protein